MNGNQNHHKKAKPDISSCFFPPNLLEPTTSSRRTSKDPTNIRRAQNLIPLQAVRKGERVRFGQTQPLSRCDESQHQRERSQHVTRDGEAGARVGTDDGVGGTAACAGEDEEDKEGVDFPFYIRWLVNN